MGAVVRKESLDVHPTAMASRPSWTLRLLGRLFFSKVAFDEAAQEIIRSAARRGTVVYVMRDRSYLDYLYFNWAYLRRGLPLARFANGLGSFFLHPWKVMLRWLFARRKDRSEPAAFAEALEREESALLFLRKPPTLAALDPEFRINWVLDLIRLQRARERPILLVPQLLLWTREPERFKKSVVDVVFGERDAPGRIRGFWLFLRNHKRAFAKVGQPLDLKEFLARFPGQSDEVLAKKVRWMLLHYLTRERQVVLGPVAKSPRRIAAEVLRALERKGTLREIAEAQKQPLGAVEQRARKLLKEIGARLSIRGVRAFSFVLNPVFNRLYDGIELDEPGLDHVREAMRRMPVVLVPCHRSHMDYLLVSYLFFLHGLIPPHIAAGKNLSFWPLGWMFRKGGAFFLRRSFRGDRLYAAVFRGYVHALLREGFPVEFFIEGGRSRTGKMLFPKTGLLSMMVDAYLDGKVRDLAFVPIHIAYQKIIESGSYSRELQGGEKQKEDLKGLLSLPKVLRSRYGRVYLDFAEPIPLSAFCAARGVRPGADLGEAERRDLVRALAMRVTFDITRVARAAPSALAAAVLLGEGRRGITRDRFLAVVHRLRDLLRAKHVRLPKAMGGPSTEHAMDESVKLFEENGLVEVKDRGDVTVYQVPDGARLQLDYYKNAILHALVPESIVAGALLADGSGAALRVRLRERARRVSRLLKYEFIFRPGVEFDALLDDAVHHLERMGLVTVTDGEIRAVPELRPDLRLMAGLVENFIEAYAAVARGLVVLARGALPERELLQTLLEDAQAQVLTGEIHRYEAASKPVFENALRYFRDEGVLASVPEEDGGHGEVMLAAGVDEARLREIEASLRGLLVREA